MNEELAIEILKQATIETTTGACEKCPRKDKNKNCIGCLDTAKEQVLLEVERLNNKEEQLIRKLEDLIIVGEQVENEWAVDICKMIIKELKGSDSNE